MKDAGCCVIEMTTLSCEYKLHYLLRNTINPICKKDICNNYDQYIYDYYNLVVELLELLTKRKLLIISYFEMQHKIGTNLFPCTITQIIDVHRKIQYNKNKILNNWLVYNTILNKYIINYG